MTSIPFSSSLMALMVLMTTTTTFVQARPNFIVMQPDDVAFFEEWTPPAHFPRGSDIWTYEQALKTPSSGLPHLDRLRANGLTMTQAYAASSMCGTSRYTSMTGRYASRSATGRERGVNGSFPLGEVVIPNTKLENVDGYGQDCGETNLAQTLQQNGYRTGVVGKWHLSGDNINRLDYETVRSNMHQCGWEYAEAIYPENLGTWSDDLGNSHNMEHVAYRGTEFISQAETDERPFFLYFNPTSNHGSGDIYEALTQYSCLDTVEGRLEQDLVVPGMTEGTTCEAYRQSVIDRAASTDAQSVGTIWVDDSIGALLTALERGGQLDNTFFLFQMDHGKEGKGTLYEPGVRIAQYIHYPNGNFAAGSSFDGLVSTIDIAATVLEYAEIGQSSPGYYEMDGVSWKSAVETYVADDEYNYWRDERCLVFEEGVNRAVRCGCAKYMADPTVTEPLTTRNDVISDSEVLFDLCGGAKTALTTTAAVSPETEDLKEQFPIIFQELQAVFNAHVSQTAPSETLLFADLPTPSTLDFGGDNQDPEEPSCLAERETCVSTEDCCEGLTCNRRGTCRVPRLR